MSIMGKRIHDKRIECGLTMEELGDKLGVQRQSVCKWEKGEVQNIKRSYIAKMAEIFDCNPVWLMGFENAPDVTVTYSAPGADTVVAQAVNDVPVIGKSATMAKRLRLYKAAAGVADEALDVAIQLLETMTVSATEPEITVDGYTVKSHDGLNMFVRKD